MHDNDDNDDPSNLGSKSWQEKHSIISATLTESIESNTSSIVVYVMVETVIEFPYYCVWGGIMPTTVLRIHRVHQISLPRGHSQTSFSRRGR